MSERLPTTDEIRRSLSYAIGYGIGSLTTSRDDEIPGDIVRRWLNSVKADELEEVVEEYDRIFVNSEIVKMASPEIYWAGTADAVNHLFQKTRSRIEGYRKGGAE